MGARSLYLSPSTLLDLPFSSPLYYLPYISPTSPPYLEQTMGTHAFNELALTIDSLFFIAIFFDVALYCVVRLTLPLTLPLPLPLPLTLTLTLPLTLPLNLTRTPSPP